MTQKEFDAQMGQLYYEQEKALQPLRMQVDEFLAKNAELRSQVSAIYAQMDRIKMQRLAVETQIKALNRQYHDRRHELLQLAPEKPDVPKHCPLNEGYIQNFSSL